MFRDIKLKRLLIGLLLISLGFVKSPIPNKYSQGGDDIYDLAKKVEGIYDSPAKRVGRQGIPKTYKV